MNNDSLNERNEITQNSILLKPFQKIANSKENLNKVDLSLNMLNGRIVSQIDSSTNSINDLTISNIGDKYVSYIKSKKNDNKKFLIISDDNLNVKVFSQIFASSLKFNDIEVFFPSNNNSINLATSFSNINELFGGVVSFSLHPVNKNILSINFFNNDGSLLSNEDSAFFNKNIFSTLETNLKTYNEKIDMLKPLNINKYLSTLPPSQNLSNITVSVNNSHNMSQEIIENFFTNNQIRYFLTKNKKPSNNKNIKKATLNSLKNKSDISLSFLPNNNFYEIAIKHKKQQIFYNLNDLSAMYLYYQIKYRETDNEYFSNKYIVKNISSSDLISIIAKKHKIIVKEYQNFYQDLSINKDLKKEMIFATNGNNYFINGDQKNYISDPLYSLQLFLEMISFFKKQNKTLYDVLQEMSIEYGIFRHSKSTQNMDVITASKLFNITAKTMNFNNQKIIRLDKKEKNIDLKILKIQLEDKTKITFIHSKKTNQLTTYLSLHFIPSKKDDKNESVLLEKNSNYMNLIIKEKKIVEFIKIFNDDHFQKKSSWKDFLKYFVFIGIFIGIFIILFTTLYSEGGNPLNIFKDINDLIKSNSLLMYMLPLLLLMIIFPIFCNSMLIGRMLKVQGQKVKMRHLMIGSSIGIVISNITPLSVGGDIASYWYLRRKSFEREPLIATFLATSFLYQVVGALISLIFIPMGLVLYSDIFLSGSPISLSIITFILIGFLGNIIGALFIGVFSFNQKAQSLFINLWIKLTSLNPLTISRDPYSQAASFQYAFVKIRTSSLMIFKNISLTLEFIFWRILPYFVNLGAILAITSGLMKPNNELWGGRYLNFLIFSSILAAANAISITPGGSGTSQFLQTEIFLELFRETDQNGNPVDVVQVSKIYSLLSTILFFIIPTIISAFLLFTVWMGEKRVDKYKKIKRVISYENKNTQNKNIRKYTRFYKISSIIWVLGLLAPLLAYYLSYASMK